MQVHHIQDIACAFFLPLDPLFKAPHFTQYQQTGVTLRVLGRQYVYNISLFPRPCHKMGICSI